MCDEDVFEINDFSTSSDWERFIADIEEILTQWNLANTSASDFMEDKSIKTERAGVKSSKLFADSRLWSQKHEQIKFGKVAFSLAYFSFDSTGTDKKEVPVDDSMKDFILARAWTDMNSIEHDWPASGHPLVRYYGLSQFLVLSPINSETISTEDRTRHLLGSAAVALHNCDCEIPFFCQVGQLNRRLFLGVLHLANGYRTYFDMIQFPEVPFSYQYLSELLVLFKKKLYSSFSYTGNHWIKSQDESKPRSKIHISVRFTYLLFKWPTHYFVFSGSPHRFLEQFSYFRNVNENEITETPVASRLAQFGDQVKQIQLATTWPSIAEELVLDNAYHSDLQPRNAPRWSIRVLFQDQHQSTHCHLVEILQLFTKLSSIGPALVRSYLNAPTSEQTDTDVRSALDRLASGSANITSTTNQLLSQLKQNLVISSSSTFQFANYEDLISLVFDKESSTSQVDPLDQLKSAPIDSLAWRIAHLSGNVYAQTKQVPLLAQIWKSFVEKVRQHWDQCKLLPNMGSEGIDLSQCLFHQKLEMLNCCIQHKIKREKEELTKISEEEDEEDEFYDAIDEEVSEEKGEGQLETLVLDDSVVYLLDRPKQPIYIPVTQDPAPMTEETLANQVSNLHGADDASTKIRLQSAGLLSDMEAFKAANPGAKFEDFIRWHSPRDWVELTEEDENFRLGQVCFGLSRRMRDSVTWRELWNMAKAVPVKRQQRLFNYTKEAETILHQLENCTVPHLVQWLLPILAKGVAFKLIVCRQEILDFIHKNQTDLDLSLLLQFDQATLELNHSHEVYSNFCQQLLSLEFEMVNFFSLFHKFITAYESQTNKSFIDLCNEPEVKQFKVRSKMAGTGFRKEEFIQFVTRLLLEPEVEFSNTSSMTELVVRFFADSERFQYEQNTSVGDRLPEERRSPSFTNQPLGSLPPPTGKEFIFRASSIARPAPYSRPSSHRMYTLLGAKSDFRIATAFTEDTAYF